MDMFSDIIFPVLREYQTDVRDRVRTTCTKVPHPIRVILQASTGAGKSVIGLDLMLRCAQRGKRCLFIVSGRALVNQIEKDHLLRSNVGYGIIMAGRGQNRSALIQVASKETLACRTKAKRMAPPAADLVIIDEAHESMAKEWVDLLDLYTSAVVVGLTATPALGNGKGLGAIYNGMDTCISTKRLVDDGWLVPCKVFAPDKPDLRGIKIVNGDYHNKQLSERMDKPKLTGGVVENWRKYAEGKKTVVFGCNIAHAKHMQEEFLKAGYAFGHIDQTTEDDEREQIFSDIRAGKLLGFTNVSVARRGLDLPCLEVACVCRPTKSLVLWLQMIGRIRRPWTSPDGVKKESCMVIDHAGACDHHCMPDDEIAWTLTGNVNDDSERKNNDPNEPKRHTCPQCSCVFTGKRCPSCGYELAERAPAENTIEHADGILVERVGRSPVPHSEMQTAFNALVGQAANTNRKAGYVAALFSKEYGMPPWEVRPKLANLPKRKKGEWQRMAAEIWPSFCRKQANDF